MQKKAKKQERFTFMIGIKKKRYAAMILFILNLDCCQEDLFVKSVLKNGKR